MQVNGRPHGPAERPRGRYLAGLSLAALGVVYGDIGTSPIYAIRESFHGSYGIPATQANVLGVLSLIFWSLIIVISVKYLGFVMQADNRGEGGIIALTALVAPPERMRSKSKGTLGWLALAGLFGASLLYGDSMITPAISVLSAVEGLEVATPFFRPYVIPITIVILIGLFLFQKRGTAGIGAIFGPVTMVWFLVLATMGVTQIWQHPDVLRALWPGYGFDFFARNSWRGVLVLGSVFLVVTGGEALYADMGHFGKLPIRLTWFCFVLPALVLNYFGQGALIIARPETLEHPFFRMAPEWALYPLVGLTTAATVIASQAVISGAFSLTRQAVQLGYFPRLGIQQTSTKEIGQIYIPGVNWALMVACIGLVLGFRTSSSLASAYGVAVTTDMVFTTILFAVVAKIRWKWSAAAVAALAGFFLIVDLGFWAANLPKIPHGGWFPLVIAALVFTIMTTWKKGRAIVGERISSSVLPVDLFIKDVANNPPHRVRGTAIYMYGNRGGTPPALLHNLKHNQVLHERVVFLTVVTEEIPYVSAEDRLRVESLGENIYRITAHYGFAEDPDIPTVLEQCDDCGGAFQLGRTSFFLGRETLIPSKAHGMPVWRDHLFALMSQNAARATAYFRIPPNRVVELGTQIEL